MRSIALRGDSVALCSQYEPFPAGICMIGRIGRIGDFVQVEQLGAWWKARVLRLQADGRVLIHYLGDTSVDDEVVPRSRILLPRSASGAVPPEYLKR